MTTDGGGTRVKPILLLDVDGVLNPFPDTPEGYSEYNFFAEDDEPIRLNSRHAEWLQELAEIFDIAWVSAWGKAANELICPIFGLPSFPVVVLPPPPFEPHEKVPAVAAFTEQRPAAWLEDDVTPEARAWAAQRTVPALVLEVNPATGLTGDVVDELRAWEATLTSLDDTGV
jgi:hypothetical protein